MRLFVLLFDTFIMRIIRSRIQANRKSSFLTFPCGLHYLCSDRNENALCWMLKMKLNPMQIALDARGVERRERKSGRSISPDSLNMISSSIACSHVFFNSNGDDVAIVWVAALFGINERLASNSWNDPLYDAWIIVWDQGDAIFFSFRDVSCSACERTRAAMFYMSG